MCTEANVQLERDPIKIHLNEVGLFFSRSKSFLLFFISVRLFSFLTMMIIDLFR